MKNYIFLSLSFFSTLALANEQQILSAILASDYHAFTNAMATTVLTAQQINSLQKAANKQVILRQKMVVRHSFAPAICTESFQALGFGLLAKIGGLLATGTIIRIMSCLASRHYRDEAFGFTNLLYLTLSGAVTATSLVYMVKNLIDAYKQPKRLLDSAMKISNALASL